MALVIDIKTGVKLDIPHELGMSGYRQLCVENVDTREGTIQECPLLDFKEKGHIYTYDEKVVPSVSQCLWPLVSPYFTKEAADRGTNVHEWCNYFDQGGQEYDKLPEEYRGYIDAWFNFQMQYNLIDKTPIIEKKLYSSIYFFAGRIDYIYLDFEPGKIVCKNVYLQANGKFKEEVRCKGRAAKLIWNDFQFYLRCWNIQQGRVNWYKLKN